MLENKKFSIIIPAYNAEKFIERSINSVLSQRYSNYEVIVIDDGSIDNTVKVVEQYDSNVVKLLKQNNSGVSGARSKGISFANGDFICFLDADDIYYDNHLSTLNDMISEFPEDNFFITGYRNILLSGNTEDVFVNYSDRKCHKEFDFFATVSNHGVFYNTNCICIRNSVFQKVGVFQIGVAQGEDTDMWYRVAAYNSVIISPCITNARYRDFSVATKQRVFTYDWIFEKRLDDILNDVQVPTQRKNSLLKDMEDRKISKIRHKLLESKRKDAYLILKSINRNLVSTKRLVSTIACFFVPNIILLNLINRRDAGYYEDKKS